MPEITTLGEFTEETKTGEKIEYVIQTAPAQMTEEIVEHMTKFFLPREPTCICVVLIDDHCVQLIRKFWRKQVSHGTTLVALLKENDRTTKLIGVNVATVVHKNRSETKKTNHVYYDEIQDALDYIAARGNLYEKYGVESYLSGYGLSVDPEYHGYKVGLRLLESRRPLCKQLGVEATGTLFTGPVSQKLAKKVGFEVLYEEDYYNFEVNGKAPFKTVPGKFQMMGLKF